MKQAVFLILAWVIRVLVLGIILATIIFFLMVCGIAAGIGGGM